MTENQRFRDMFCKECRGGIKQTRMDDGTKMCNRLYKKGYCFKGCKRPHNKKNAAEQVYWKCFLKEILAKWKVKNDNGDFTRNCRS